MLELLAWRSYFHVPAFLPEKPRLIVDLGANIGVASRWFLHQFPEAMVIAVEPEANNAGVLRRNLAPYGARAVVVEACVAAKRGRVSLEGGNGDWGFRMTHVGDTGRITALPLEDIIESAGVASEQRIDLLKCDIEGAEREVFGASAPWIGRVGVAVVECHTGIIGEDICRLAGENGAAMKLLDRIPNKLCGFETVVLAPMSGKAS